MKGKCGEEFKPYIPYCEECRYYDYCMKAYKEYTEIEKDNAPGDNFPLLPLQKEINDNKEHFKRYKPISTADVIIFRNDLDNMTIEVLIKTFEFYKEEK